MTEKPCDSCQATAPYEAIFLGDSDTDIAASLPHHCPKCEARIEREQQAEDRAKALQQARQRAEDNIARVIPPILQQSDTEHPGFNRRAWDVLQKWNPAERWLVMVGETRLSKSRIAALLAMLYCRKGRRIEWTTANAFQWAATREFDDCPKERERAREYLRRWKNTPLLVFDDLGKGTCTDTVQRHLFELIDHRQTHDLPMIISCNTHPLKMIAAGMFSQDRGAPIISRIMEQAKQIVTLQSPTHKAS